MNKWLYLDTYVQITFDNKGKECLLFNSLDSKKIVFFRENYKLIKKLNNNEYSIQLSEKEIIEQKEIIEILENNFFGGIIESELKPFIFYPILKIQRDLRKFKNLSYRQPGYKILENLFELTIYINGRKKILVNETINLIKLTEYSSILKINIIVENFNLNKNKIKDFFSLLNNVNIQYKIILKIKEDEYFDFISEVDLKKINYFSIVVITDNISFNDGIFKEKNVGFIFKIQNEFEYNSFINKVSNREIEYNFELDIPKCDPDFLRKYVFLNKSDILEMNLTKRSYDANKILNKNFFGKLIIKDNKIYNAEIKGKAIAKLKNKLNIKEIIFDALVHSNQWFLTRGKVRPCKSCVFKYICPPISDYELKANKYNFCNIIN